MTFKKLKTKALTKKELKTINAGLSGDCEPGETMVGKNGLIWVCNAICEWELPDPGSEE